MSRTDQPLKISSGDVRAGDMILYVLNQKPEFLPFTKENLWPNFCVMIDRLIIAMGGSMCTHSAIAAAPANTVVEATLPYCRYRTPLYSEGYTVLVRRVKAAGKGAKVLDFVPPGIGLDAPSKDNLPYAYAQSAVAALLCLFRRKMPADPAEREALLVFLQLILHPLVKSIDDYIAEKQGKDGAWFCSQLVTFCYDRAAEADPDYRLDIPMLDFSEDTVIEWLVSKVSPDKMASLRSTGRAENGSFAESAGGFALASAGVFRAAGDLLSILEGADCLSGVRGEPEFLSGAKLSLSASPAALASASPAYAAERILADAFRLLTVLGKDLSRIPSQATVAEYKESLVMPSDLERERSLAEIGRIYDFS